MNINSDEFNKIIKEEVDRAFPNGKVSLEPEEEDRVKLSQAIGNVESLAELANDPEEVKWHLSNVRELFGIDV